MRIKIFGNINYKSEEEYEDVKRPLGKGYTVKYCMFFEATKTGIMIGGCLQ
jgi:hypothetical protein